MIGVFLTPSFIKAFHNHHHFHCTAKHDKHFHKKHDKCVICEFNFSGFEHNFSNNYFYKSEFQIFLYDFDLSEFPAKKTIYKFLLRAPPYQ